MGKSRERIPVGRTLTVKRLPPLSLDFGRLKSEAGLGSREWSELTKIVKAARQRALAFEMGLDLTAHRSLLGTLRDYLLVGRTLGEFVEDAGDAPNRLHRRLLAIGCENAALSIRNGELLFTEGADMSPLETAELLEALIVMEDQVWQGGAARKTRLGVWEQMIGEIFDWLTRFSLDARTRFPIGQVVKAATAELPDGFKPTSLRPDALRKAIAKARRLDPSLRAP